MSLEAPLTNPPALGRPVPRVIYGEGVDPALFVDATAMAQDMRGLGISDEGIEKGTIYIDPKSRLQTFGTHYPNKIGRLRFRSVPEIQQAEGDIIRLSATMKGKPRTAEGMNRTLVHELEHLAQQDRHDKKLTQGHVAIWGLAAAGAILGNRRGKSMLSKTAGTVAGAVAGHSLGYMIAPHERQARARARQVTSASVQRDS